MQLGWAKIGCIIAMGARDPFLIPLKSSIYGLAIVNKILGQIVFFFGRVDILYLIWLMFLALYDICASLCLCLE